jgi:hypothetical protein
MAFEIEAAGKKLTSIKEACSDVTYSRDYVTRLAREGKIVASLIGRQWFVDLDSLKNYAAQSQVESKLRKAQLREERKQEQLFYKTKEQQQATHQQFASSVRTRAAMASGSVLAVGLTLGVFGYTVFSTPFNLNLVLSLPPSGVTQSSQTAVNANSVPTQDNVTKNTKNLAPQFSTKEVETFEFPENGILILPRVENADLTDVFSDEVEIRNATSGIQKAVLVSADGDEADREVPFVLVPINTTQN